MIIKLVCSLKCTAACLQNPYSYTYQLQKILDVGHRTKSKIKSLHLWCILSGKFQNVIHPHLNVHMNISDILMSSYSFRTECSKNSTIAKATFNSVSNRRSVGEARRSWRESLVERVVSRESKEPRCHRDAACLHSCLPASMPRVCPFLPKG